MRDTAGEFDLSPPSAVVKNQGIQQPAQHRPSLNPTGDSKIKCWTPENLVATPGLMLVRLLWIIQPPVPLDGHFALLAMLPQLCEASAVAPDVRVGELTVNGCFVFIVVSSDPDHTFARRHFGLLSAAYEDFTYKTFWDFPDASSLSA
jgi:hypothetical protein